jgi:hypothetical protein
VRLGPRRQNGLGSGRLGESRSSWPSVGGNLYVHAAAVCWSSGPGCRRYGHIRGEWLEQDEVGSCTRIVFSSSGARAGEQVDDRAGVGGGGRADPNPAVMFARVVCLRRYISATIAR